MPNMTSNTNFDPRILVHTNAKPRASEAVTNLGLPLQRPIFLTGRIVPFFENGV